MAALACSPLSPRPPPHFLQSFREPGTWPSDPGEFPSAKPSFGIKKRGTHEMERWPGSPWDHQVSLQG